MNNVVAPPGPRRGASRDARRRQARARRTRLVLVAGIVAVALAVVAAWFTLRPVVSSMFADNDYPGPGSGSVQVTVPEGASGSTIGQVLRDAGVVKSAGAFVSAAADNAKAAGIQPGSYDMKKEMSAAGALEILVDPANRVVLNKVVVKEGQRVSDVLPEAAKVTGIPIADLQAAAKDPAAIGLPAQAGGLVEGWLFPATYETDPKTTAASLLGQMVAKTVAELTELNVPTTKWHDVIVEASLVEAERGANPEDAGKIARVLDNRMAAKRPLQLDTTVNYVLNRRKVAVSTAETQIDSPYNTYRVTGLPKGAISNPGLVAIKAVLDPTPGPWLYFVAVNPDTGETKYATTEAEFWKLTEELNAWLKQHPGR